MTFKQANKILDSLFVSDLIAIRKLIEACPKAVFLNYLPKCLSDLCIGCSHIGICRKLTRKIEKVDKLIIL